MDLQKDLTKIDYRNVFFKSYVFIYKDFGEVFKSFLDEIKKSKITPKGMFFLSVDDIKLTNDDVAIMEATLYQPAEENELPEGSELMYADAIVYNNMVSKVVEGDFMTNTEPAYNELIAEAQAKGKKISSSFFHEFIVREDENGNKKAYCIIKAKMD
jgi:hypothetical protein